MYQAQLMRSVLSHAMCLMCLMNDDEVGSERESKGLILVLITGICICIWGG